MAARAAAAAGAAEVSAEATVMAAEVAAETAEVAAEGRMGEAKTTSSLKGMKTSLSSTFSYAVGFDESSSLLPRFPNRRRRPPAPTRAPREVGEEGVIGGCALASDRSLTHTSSPFSSSPVPFSSSTDELSSLPMDRHDHMGATEVM